MNTVAVTPKLASAWTVIGRTLRMVRKGDKWSAGVRGCPTPCHHVTKDGVKTLCGREVAVTMDDIVPSGNTIGCQRCFKALT